MSSENILEVKNLSKRYSGSENDALPKLNFALKKGESLGLIGKNGTGKSTLLKILSSVSKPTTGEVFIYGKITSVLELGGGFHPDLTGFDNIFFSASIMGYSRGEVKQNIKEIEEFCELGDALNKPVKTYSSGMLLRLAFSIFSHLPSNVLVLDEVMHVGDSAFLKKCRNRLKYLKSKNVTLIIASHNLNDLTNYVELGLLLKPNDYLIDRFESIQERYILGDQKFLLRKNRWINNFLKLDSVDLRKNDQNGAKTKSFLTSDSIHLTFNIEILIKELKLNTVVNLFSSENSVAADGEVFHGPNKTYLLAKGRYSISCIIPKYFLNKGLYFINIWFGHHAIEYFLAENVTSFNVELADWEHQMSWNIEGFDQPIRQRFNWKLKTI